MGFFLQAGGAGAALDEIILPVGGELRLFQRRLGTVDRRFTRADVGVGGIFLLSGIVECGLVGIERCFRLRLLLAVDTVIDLREQRALADFLIILHRHVHDITAHLRAHRRDITPYEGVVGHFDGGKERRQPPGVKHQRHAGETAEQHENGNGGKKLLQHFVTLGMFKTVVPVRHRCLPGKGKDGCAAMQGGSKARPTPARKRLKSAGTCHYKQAHRLPC
ncbi:hypothetical protein D3C72_1007490 [compost metagenome]